MRLKSIYIIIAFTLLVVVSICRATAQDRVLVGGTLSDKIVIINRVTKEIEWSYSESRKCNSILQVRGKNILYAYEDGATLMRPNGEIIFEYKVGENEELQSVSEIKGGYMFGISGCPIRVVEVNRRGEVVKEFSYDSKVNNIHRQFRQIAKTKRGNYVVPISAQKRVAELDKDGSFLRDIKLSHSALYVTIAKDGDWLMTTGHAGFIYKINSRSGDVVNITDKKSLGNGINIEFAAGIAELKNGNYLLANWLGHKGNINQPFLIEIDKDGEVVWSMKRIEGKDGYTYAAGIEPIK